MYTKYLTSLFTLQYIGYSIFLILKSLENMIYPTPVYVCIIMNWTIPLLLVMWFFLLSTKTNNILIYSSLTIIDKKRQRKKQSQHIS